MEMGSRSPGRRGLRGMLLGLAQFAHRGSQRDELANEHDRGEAKWAIAARQVPGYRAVNPRLDRWLPGPQ